MTLILGFVLSP